jgi:hypothetical protein
LPYQRMTASIARRWRVAHDEWRLTSPGTRAAAELRDELDELIAEYRRLIDDVTDNRLARAGTRADGSD